MANSSENQTDDGVVLRKPPVVIVYTHSTLLYWWPVWLTGFIMAGITYWEGYTQDLAGEPIQVHPASNLGVIFLFVLFMVIIITNLPIRGLASAMVVLSIAFIVVLLAYFQMWDAIFDWLGNLRIYLNLGAYFWFSTILFLVWGLAIFIVDRMTYWEFKPGQVTKVIVLGAGSKSYDTDNLVLEKFRDDLFRHWILGLGTGDMIVHPYGAQRESISLRNVMFVGSKIDAIQQLIATDPSTQAIER